MTDREDEASSAAPGKRRGFMPWSLSDKLLLLTVIFVMVAEILIYIPSIANFRNVWLQEKLDTAALIAKAAAAAPAAGLPRDLERDMLHAVGLEAAALRGGGRRWLIAAGDMPSDVAAHHDLTTLKPLDSIRAAFATLVTPGDRLIMVSGRPPAGADRFEIVLREAQLRAAMLAYSRNILILSLAISAITGALVYTALRTHIVRPMERLSANIRAFSAAPEDVGSTIVPSGRRDEIGAAEACLADMQASLRELLGQRRHLADLGLAVSKINHDLRNILASAQLFSDRMGAVQDPIAQRFAPKVIRAVDRAIGYTQAVLSYGQATEAAPRRQLLSLAVLVDDVADVLALNGHERVRWENRIAPGVEVDADPEQLFRVLMNLCRNALEAVDDGGDPAVIRRVWAEGERRGSVTHLRICDTGPGLPERARAGLFKPFLGSVRRGGTGLGLAIAAEIVRAHGGAIDLVDHAGAGTIFEVAIPDRPVSLDARRQAKGS
jgi:signal transduction histidine kinase